MTQAAKLAPTGASATIDADFVSTVRCKSPIEKVFESLTDPSRLSSWWVEASGSGLKGGELTFLFPVEKLICRVDEANNSIVKWTPLVCEPLPDWVGTTISFALSRTENGESQIDFRHAGLARLECFETCRKGWEFYLPILVDHVDAGDGDSKRSPNPPRED